MDCLIDIIFVLDQSASVGSNNFELMRSFVSGLIDRMDIHESNTRVGLVTYSVGVRSAFNLGDHSSVSSLKSAISSIHYYGGYRDTAAALRHVRTVMLTSAAGDRPRHPNVMVVFTNGQSQDTAATVVSIR